MQVIYKKRFLKHYKKLSPKLQTKVKDTLALFMTSPTDPILNNHALIGEFAGCRSLDVTGDYRIIFEDIGGGIYEIVELLDVGSHSQLYG